MDTDEFAETPPSNLVLMRNLDIDEHFGGVGAAK